MCVQAETPAAAVTRAQAIKAKYGTATQADADDLVGIATAFPTDADVQKNVCDAMDDIAYYGEAKGARILIAAGGHRVAVAALGAFSTNREALHLACRALYYVAAYGGADAITSVRAVDGSINKLRQASGAMRATSEFDWASYVLSKLG